MEKMPVVVVVTLLWFIVIMASYVILKDTGYYSKLFPVYTMGMVGSIITVQSLVKKINGGK